MSDTTKTKTTPEELVKQIERTVAYIRFKGCFLSATAREIKNLLENNPDFCQEIIDRRKEIEETIIGPGRTLYFIDAVKEIKESNNIKEIVVPKRKEISPEIKAIIEEVVESYRKDLNSRFDNIEKSELATFEEFKVFSGEEFATFFKVGSGYFFMIDRFVKGGINQNEKRSILGGVRAAGSFEKYISKKREETFISVTKNLKSALVRRLPENTLSITLRPTYLGAKGIEVLGRVYYKDGSSNELEVRAIPVQGFIVSFHYRYLLTFMN